MNAAFEKRGERVVVRVEGGSVEPGDVVTVYDPNGKSKTVTLGDVVEHDPKPAARVFEVWSWR